MLPTAPQRASRVECEAGIATGGGEPDAPWGAFCAAIDRRDLAADPADEDAGGGWLEHLDSLALVDQISFRALGDFSAELAGRLGASPRYCSKIRMASGDSPILLLNEAANRIGAGEITIAAVVGGEALRTAAHRAAAAQGTDISAQNASRAMPP